MSNMFFLSLFFEGATSSAATCQYFNITGRNVDDPTSSTTTSAAFVASTSGYAPAIDVYYPPSSGLSTGAKAGLGIGIAAAVALGIGAGWFIFGRRKKQSVPEPAETVTRGGSYEPAKGYQERYQLSAVSPVVSTRYERHELHGSPQQDPPQTNVHIAREI